MSPTGIVASSVPEVSEQINGIAAKLTFKHKAPELAKEVKDLFDRLVWALKIQTLASSELSERQEHNELNNAHEKFVQLTPALAQFSDIVHNAYQHSDEHGRQVFQLVSMLAASSCDCIRTPESISSIDAPNHSVLLALVRGYRFLIEADDKTVQERYPSRLALVSKVRGLELKAASTGTVI
jgi:hypothetical protein